MYTKNFVRYNQSVNQTIKHEKIMQQVNEKENNNDLANVSDRKRDDEAIGVNTARQIDSGRSQSEFVSNTKLYLFTSSLLAAASILLHSDKGIPYARHIWYYLREIVSQKKLPPLNKAESSIKENIFGSVSTFFSSMGINYSWYYLDPINAALRRKNSKNKEEIYNPQVVVNNSEENKKTLLIDEKNKEEKSNNVTKQSSLLPMGISTSVAIGSAIMRDKRGVSYAQRFFEPSIGYGNSHSSPSRDVTRAGAVFVWAVTYVATGLLFPAAQKIYDELTEKGKGK